MIIIRNQKMRLGYDDSDIEKAIYKNLRTKKYKNYKIIRESLDSRKHDNIHFQVSIGVNADNEEKIIKSVHNNNIMLTKEQKFTFPHILNTDVRDFLDDNPTFRPVIIGSGPAGYHAAIKLSLAGFKPIVLERGKPVEERGSDVESFWDGKGLDTDSNVCFGEGGAGTYSDGKLNTGNKDKDGYIHEVLETFVKYGADPEILYKAKPHIGTDVLRNILKNMRSDIERYGGEVRFGHKLVDIQNISTFDSDSDIRYSDNAPDSKLYRYKLVVQPRDSEKYELITPSVILAIGHSARDTYEMLKAREFSMEQKPFAMGVRVEHSAEMINQAMYGKDYKAYYGDSLPAADYKLVYHTENGRNVFSFCMCPGGYVVNSATEEGITVVNGMSYSGRAGSNSNSAIVVSINPEDFESEDVLSGADLQKKLEQAAYKAGNGGIPLQLYGDFKDNIVSSEIRDVVPAIKGKWNFADLRQVLPEFMVDALLEAMQYFGTRIEDFDNPDTVMTAIESRTSSPVKIIRDKEFLMAPDHPGIIPCGEGAGYAGGITSAAVDGIKAAEAVSEYLVEDIIQAYKDAEMAKYINK